MAVGSRTRVAINHVARDRGGAVAPGSLLYVENRVASGVSFGYATIYSAPTGGSTIAQPLVADANGRYTGWVQYARPYNLVESIGGAVRRIPWDASAAHIGLGLGTGGGDDGGWWVVGVNYSVFASGWGNYGSGYHQAAYMKTSEGLVNLRGLINRTSGTGTQPFILHDEFRPAYQHFFYCQTGAGVGVVTVSPSGAVGLSSGTPFVALDSIQYHVDY